jgi:hypothetical protein
MLARVSARFADVIFYLPLLLVVGATTLYQISQKSVSPLVNPMLSVTVNYVTALVVSLLILPFYPGNSLRASWKNLNWASVTVGVAIVGIELGFLVAYRAGWRISVASLIANVTTSLLLVALGLVFFPRTLERAKRAGRCVLYRRTGPDNVPLESPCSRKCWP